MSIFNKIVSFCDEKIEKIEQGKDLYVGRLDQVSKDIADGTFGNQEKNADPDMNAQLAMKIKPVIHGDRFKI